MRQWPRRIATVLLLALAAIQLVPPAAGWPTPPAGAAIEHHVTVPRDVHATLRRACYDCHSAGTRWPWYGRIAPVSWFLAGHVNHGREHLDFSDWRRVPEAERRELLGSICGELRKGSMPLRAYLLLHPEARVSPAEVAAVCAWSAAGK